jgi:hypothetical protein
MQRVGQHCARPLTVKTGLLAQGGIQMEQGINL